MTDSQVSELVDSFFAFGWLLTPLIFCDSTTNARKRRRRADLDARQLNDRSMHLTLRTKNRRKCPPRTISGGSRNEPDYWKRNETNSSSSGEKKPRQRKKLSERNEKRSDGTTDFVGISMRFGATFLAECSNI